MTKYGKVNRYKEPQKTKTKEDCLHSENQKEFPVFFSVEEI